MRCKPPRIQTPLIALALGACVLISVTATHGADIFVTKAGSPDPPHLDSPFRMVEAALCAVPPDGTIDIGAGTYRETFTTDTPATLTASGGNVFIGDLSNSGQTTLTIVTYNTHLFGPDDLFTAIDPANVIPVDAVPCWQDDQRAAQIAAVILADDPDVILLQEVWDDDLAGVSINALVINGPYVDWFHGNEKDEFLDGQHSGLLILSKFPLEAPSLVHYDDEIDSTLCEAALGILIGCQFLILTPPAYLVCVGASATTIGIECPRVAEAFSSKGFIKTKITKDGFPIIIYTTHAHSGNENDEIAARGAQMAQLGLDLFNFRFTNPGAAMVMTGDFNVPGEEHEYFDVMIPAVGDLAGGHDAVRNTPDACFAEGASIWSENRDNTLSIYFNPDTKNERLDHVLSNGSADGTIELLPVRTELRKYRAPATISGDGTFGFHSDRNLSDHYGIAATFKLYRN